MNPAIHPFAQSAKPDNAQMGTYALRSSACSTRRFIDPVKTGSCTLESLDVDNIYRKYVKKSANHSNVHHPEHDADQEFIRR